MSKIIPRLKECWKKDECGVNLILGGLIIGVLVLFFIYAGAIILLTRPISEYSVDASGKFGDTFGALTSLFSGLAFAALIWTILLQRVELKLQREELRLQRQELAETRFNAILTRLMTVTQQQTSVFRSEISTIEFSSWDTRGKIIGYYEMISHVTQRLDLRIAGFGANHDDNTFFGFLQDAHQFFSMISGLSSICKTNETMIKNSDISRKGAIEVKSLLFSELPNGLSDLLPKLAWFLENLLPTEKSKGHNRFSINKLENLVVLCEQIISYQNQEFLSIPIESSASCNDIVTET